MSAIAKAVSTPAHPLHLKAGFSTSGWLAVLLLFVLAHLFAEGAQMRERLDVERGKDAASFGAICEKLWFTSVSHQAKRLPETSVLGLIEYGNSD